MRCQEHLFSNAEKSGRDVVNIYTVKVIDEVGLLKFALSDDESEWWRNSSIREAAHGNETKTRCA